MADENPNTSLLSILCREPWIYDSSQSNQIAFKEDGTGHLICKIELRMWIAAAISWSAHDPDALKDLVPIPIDDTNALHTLKSTKLSVTLQPERLESLYPGGPSISPTRQLNDDVLHESAFQPKDYTIDLQSGNFVPPFDESRAPNDARRYGLKLRFDRSPMPSREQWKKARGGPDFYKFWEWTEFVARRE